MNLAEILASAQYLTDAEGNRKAIVLDLAVWQEILALLEKIGAEQTRQDPSAIMGKYHFVPTSSEDFARRKQEEIELEE
ncbi:MAG: hypothetical protein BroJett011_40570 [Chloroflexota bacterium]|nr:MAG: hypothetical protein BroJett011_40570 [Chloroflexota bacterium]